MTFRSRRFPADYEAFDGKDLSPKGYIELDPNVDYCEQLLSSNDFFEKIDLDIYPNPAQNMITLEWEAGTYVDVEVYNMLGQPAVEAMRLSGGRKYLDTSTWENGIYVVRINQKQAGKFFVSR